MCNFTSFDARHSRHFFKFSKHVILQIFLEKFGACRVVSLFERIWALNCGTILRRPFSGTLTDFYSLEAIADTITAVSRSS